MSNIKLLFESKKKLLNYDQLKFNINQNQLKLYII